ncbi:MAG: zinc-binding dehydrogenase, partial [Myxococcales bacterium]|nr:zinc-binding dehydrogenase [Myxococcales bacterium]
DPVRRSTLRIEGLSASLLLEGLVAGEWFVHSPGGGSVGRYLTALGRARDLHSIALVGSRDPIADLWGLGADHVLIREPGIATRLSELGLPNPRIGFDGSGGLVSEMLASCLEVGGRLLIYGAATRAPLQLAAGQVVFRQLQLEGFWLHAWSRGATREEQQRRIDELSSLGANMGEYVVERFGLDDWAEALRLAETPNLRGRVVFVPT